MKLRFFVTNNLMTDDPFDQRAQVVGYETATETEIFDYITRKGSTITTAEVMANYREIIEAHEYFLKQGYGINTEFINIRPTIQGVFKDKNDSFDPSRHKIRFKAQLGRYYNQTAGNVTLEKVAASDTNPFPSELEDVTSGETNGTITPGGTALLEGARLKYDVEDPAQGIFFIAANGTETRVDKVVTFRPSQIVFVIPGTLAIGNYSLEVRTMPGKSKSIKKGFLNDKLTVS